MKAALATAILFVLSCVLAFAQQGQGSSYRIQQEDVLRIAVYGEQQINTEVVVDQSGNVSAPFVGTLRAEGKTAAELESELTEAYRQRLRLRDPKVSVTFLRFRAIRASIGGMVGRAGQYEFRPGDTILTLIHQGGGPVPDRADLRRTLLRRRDTQEVIPIDLFAMLRRGDLSQNYDLQDGDQLEIPENTKNNISVQGWVQRPGLYPYREPMTLADAIGLAGGDIPGRARMSQIKILREVAGAPGSYQLIQADYVRFVSKGDFTQNVELQPGDIINVPATNTPNWNEIANIVNSAFFIQRVLTDGLFGFRLFR